MVPRKTQNRRHIYMIYRYIWYQVGLCMTSSLHKGPTSVTFAIRFRIHLAGTYYKEASLIHILEGEDRTFKGLNIIWLLWLQISLTENVWVGWVNKNRKGHFIFWVVNDLVWNLWKNWVDLKINIKKMTKGEMYFLEGLTEVG